MHNSFIFDITMPYWTFQYSLVDLLLYIVYEKSYYNKVYSEIWHLFLQLYFLD